MGFFSFQSHYQSLIGSLIREQHFWFSNWKNKCLAIQLEVKQAKHSWIEQKKHFTSAIWSWTHATESTKHQICLMLGFRCMRTDRSKPNVETEIMSPYHSVQMRCKVFDVCVRSSMLSTDTLKSNSTFGTFSDKCSGQAILEWTGRVLYILAISRMKDFFRI